jgi:hypothetical protein
MAPFPNRKTWRFEISPYLEREARSAPRAERRTVRVRVIQDGRRRYIAYDAHSLLEQESALDPARPGRLA